MTRHKAVVNWETTPDSYDQYPNGYDEIIRGFGADILYLEEHGDYQGDYFYLLRDGEEFGWLAVGYGSCSGCDELQACHTQQEVQGLADRLFDSIIWKPRAEAREYLLGRDLSSDYWMVDDEGPKIVAGALAALEAAK